MPSARLTRTAPCGEKSQSGAHGIVDAERSETEQNGRRTCRAKFVTTIHPARAPSSSTSGWLMHFVATNGCGATPPKRSCSSMMPSVRAWSTPISVSVGTK